MRDIYYKALDEFDQLCNDDEDFKKQWGNDLSGFREWFQDVYLKDEAWKDLDN